MRARPLLFAVVFPVAAAACNPIVLAATDASPLADAPAPTPDAPLCPTQLLTGGTDVVAQGWSVMGEGPATLTDVDDYTKLETSTAANMTSGGQLLLTYHGAVEMGRPFKIQVVMLVEIVSPHNQFDAAAAILGSFTPPAGTTAERNQMIYLDPTKIGWADDNPSFPSFSFTVTDNAYHTYELSVDASGAATVRVDGVQALTRNGFTTNGAIAIGDQTNDAAVDSTLRIRSVTRLCE